MIGQIGYSCFIPMLSTLFSLVCVFVSSGMFELLSIMSFKKSKKIKKKRKLAIFKMSDTILWHSRAYVYGNNEL